MPPILPAMPMTPTAVVSPSERSSLAKRKINGKIAPLNRFDVAVEAAIVVSLESRKTISSPSQIWRRNEGFSVTTLVIDSSLSIRWRNRAEAENPMASPRHIIGEAGVGGRWIAVGGRVGPGPLGVRCEICKLLLPSTT